MSKIDLKKDLPFVLAEEEILYQGKTQPFKAPFIITMFLISTIVLTLDVVFLGVGVVASVFKELKWIAVVLFMIKIMVDIFIFTACYFVVKDKLDRAKYSRLYITSTRVILATKQDEEISFWQIEKSQVSFKIKSNFLHKLCEVFALQMIGEDLQKTFYFLAETELDKVKAVLEL